MDDLPNGRDIPNGEEKERSKEDEGPMANHHHQHEEELEEEEEGLVSSLITTVLSIRACLANFSVQMERNYQMIFLMERWLSRSNQNSNACPVILARSVPAIQRCSTSLDLQM
jgi:hypothetical protein